MRTEVLELMIPGRQDGEAKWLLGLGMNYRAL